MRSHGQNSEPKDIKQLLDEVFAISEIIKVEVTVIAEADNTYQDLDYSGYRKNRI